MGKGNEKVRKGPLKLFSHSSPTPLPFNLTIEGYDQNRRKKLKNVYAHIFRPICVNLLK